MDRPEITFKVFQFPRDQISRIDGWVDDWAIVPDSYAIGMDQLVDDEGGHVRPDKAVLDVTVKVGWVAGENRLYFLLQAYKSYWDFSRPDLHNDTFEIVVDGDAGGGALVDKGHKDIWTPDLVGGPAAAADDRISGAEAHWNSHGVHAQNYHIFIPAKDKDWCMAWGSATWVKEFPHANAVCKYDFNPGEAGHLTLEFWITPFDYAGPEGPHRAVPSELFVNKIIGLSFAVIDYRDPESKARSFWNLSRHHTMFGHASHLCAFRLMPLEPQFLKPIDAQFSWTVVDMGRRQVAFKDESIGKITSWHWQFGDGDTSAEQNPIHEYQRPGNFVTILDVEGPGGKSRRSKVWDVALR